MRNDRLLRLADVMDLVPPRKYNQNRFFDGAVSSRTVTFEPMGGADGEGYVVVNPKEGFCGSAACVLGQAAFTPDMGVFAYVDEANIDTSTGRKRTGDLGIGGLDADGNLIDCEFQAAAAAFGIPQEHAEVLFGGTSGSTRHFYTGKLFGEWGEWVSPQVVAGKLRSYVASGGDTAEASIRAWSEA